MRCMISYSRDSKNSVEQLAGDLRSLGHEAWYDQSLTGGQNWWDEIIAKINQCDLFVFALTPKGLESQACKLEYNYAAAINKRLLPVWLDGDISANLLPAALSEIQYVDYRGDDKRAAFDLAKALQNLPAARPAPDPLPDPPLAPISYLVDLSDRIVSNQPLSFQDQTEILFRLKSGLDKDDEDRDDILTLLRKLRNRDDLLAKVAKEIDALLAEYVGDAPYAAVKEPISKASEQEAQKKRTQSRSSVKEDKPGSQSGGKKKGQLTGVTIAIVVISIIVLCSGCLFISYLSQFGAY